MEKYTPQVGDYIKPDKWDIGEKLTASDGYKDNSFPGCQFRLPCYDMELAVNIKITGKSRFINGFSFAGSPKYTSRCQIEFVGDGKVSSFTGGLIYHN